MRTRCERGPPDDGHSRRAAVTGLAATPFVGAAIRAGTPPEIAKKIEADCVAVAKKPAARDKLAARNAETVGSIAAEFAAFVKAEREKWGKLITELKLKIE